MMTEKLMEIKTAAEKDQPLFKNHCINIYFIEMPTIILASALSCSSNTFEKGA